MRGVQGRADPGTGWHCRPCPAWLLRAVEHCCTCCLQCEAFAGRAKEVILAFNYARISEAAGDLQDAVTVFKVQLNCTAVPTASLNLTCCSNSLKAVGRHLVDHVTGMAVPRPAGVCRDICRPPHTSNAHSAAAT